MFFKRKKEAITINSYIDGKIINLGEIPDKVFSTKVMGDGFAMIAKDN
ncbi:PTS glucose transporter subunit IIA, partial [Clostridioides difficile]